MQYKAPLLAVLRSGTNSSSILSIEKGGPSDSDSVLQWGRNSHLPSQSFIEEWNPSHPLRDGSLALLLVEAKHKLDGGDGKKRRLCDVKLVTERIDYKYSMRTTC